MTISSLNKMFMYPKLLFTSKVIFCVNLKANLNIPLAFSQGIQGDGNVQTGLQKHVIPASLFSRDTAKYQLAVFPVSLNSHISLLTSFPADTHDCMSNTFLLFRISHAAVFLVE